MPPLGRYITSNDPRGYMFVLMPILPTAAIADRNLYLFHLALHMLSPV